MIRLFILTCLIAFPLAAHAAAELDTLLNRDYAATSFWDDGKAEVAVYDAERVVYGEPRKHTVRLITVYEDFNKEYYVKADWPYGEKPLLPVLKQNMNATIQTDTYPYHYMTTVFSERGHFGRTVKVAISSQEWCGTTYKEFQFWRDQPREVYHSYWDGEGSGVRDLPPNPNAFLEEELFLVLRGLPFREGLKVSFELYQGETTNKAPVPKSEPAELVVSEAEDAWAVTVRAQTGRRILYRFAKQYPHYLLSQEHSDGRTLALRSVERSAYWE